MKAYRMLLAVTAGIIAFPCFAQITVVPSYSQSFDSIGTALPNGWNVWTSSTSISNGTVFSWNTGLVANNAAATTSNFFRNLPGASQTWSAGLSTGTDRALGWRAGDSASRDGSITFTLSNTAGWNFESLSLQLFTPNNSGTPATFQLQYQIGSTGTFLEFSPLITYANNTAQNPLLITSISLTSGQLLAISNQSDQVTLRLDNNATSGTSWNTLALDNYTYTASAIPEPSTYASFAGAFALAGAWWHRRKNRT